MYLLSNPIMTIILGGIVLIGLFTVLDDFIQDPVNGIRFIVGLLVASMVGFGAPILLMHYFEPEGLSGLLFIPVWVLSWGVAGKLWFFIAGESDD